MTCSCDAGLDVEYLKSFRKRIIDERIPINVSLDLTARCNLNCVHCYVRQDACAVADELGTDEVCRIIDEAAEMGALYLLLTGGEPLLRADFPRIYRHAKRRGLFVNVFTNATAVSSEVVDLFRELPPWSVEVSMYGATKKTYELITQSEGSYEQCIGGVENLLAAGVNVRLKTILMTLNKDEIEMIRAMASKYGVAFHFDASIFPRLNGDPAPLEYRVSPEEAVAVEFQDEDERKRWEEAVEAGGTGAVSEKLFLCGAGVTGLHVSSNGYLRPCMMISDIQYDLRAGNLREGWHNIASRVDQALAPTDLECRGCDMKNLCGYCPGSIRLETGSYSQKLAFACDLGHRRLRELTRKTETERRYEGRQNKCIQAAI